MKTYLMRLTFLLALCVLVAPFQGCAHKQTVDQGKTAAVRDGVFVHIKSGPKDAHAVMMGLKMAQMMATDRDVLVYFDVHGIEVVLNDAAEMKMEPFGSSRAVIQGLITQGVPVYACPGCLKALGKTPENLMPGVKVAEKEAFFNFTRGRILTFDY